MDEPVARGAPRVPACLAERAAAKVNLSLSILGRRADGYHELESLVVFAAEADLLCLVPGPALGLTVSGPHADGCGTEGDNLVVKAARALAALCGLARLGRFELTKHLPVAAGIGGGSADAAAALRLLGRANQIPLDDPRLFEAAHATGADVPVCLDPRPRIMRGIGEVLSPALELPPLPAVLANPGVGVSTKDVFAALRLAPGQRLAPGEGLPAPDAFPFCEPEAVWTMLGRCSNDLEAPAVKLQPVIAEVLDALHGSAGCRLARMSGSGATCFGLFASLDAARAAAHALEAAHPHWWVRATTLGAG